MYTYTYTCTYTYACIYIYLYLRVVVEQGHGPHVRDADLVDEPQVQDKLAGGNI